MKRTSKLFALLLAAALLLGMVSACGSSGESTTSAETAASAESTPATEGNAPASEDTPEAATDSGEPKVVGVSVATATNNPHIVSVMEALTQALEAEGWTVDLQDADNDSSKQSTQFDTLVTKNVDLIVYWANDAQAAVADCKKAADAGIPVIAYFADVAEEAHQYIEAYVGADQLVIADAVGQYAKEILGDSGKVVIVNGKEGKTDFVQRSEGFRKALEGSGIEILAEEYSDSDRTQAQTIMENFLTTYPDIDLVFTTSDDFGYGAYNAIKAAGKAGQIKIVSIDGQQEVLQAIKAGEWDLTVYQTPAMMAEKLVEVAKRVFAGETIEDYNQNTDYYLVTAENVDDYLE